MIENSYKHIARAEYDLSFNGASQIRMRVRYQKPKSVLSSPWINKMPLNGTQNSFVTKAHHFTFDISNDNKAD